MIKILFLDIDGVVNSVETARRAQKKGGIIGIDPHLSLLVHRIIEATDCKVVLSSTWRLIPASLEECREKFPIISVTPSLRGCIRGKEIQVWLDTMGFNDVKYAILDDDGDMLPEQIPNFFQTTWEKGLTEEIANNVIHHLGLAEK